MSALIRELVTVWWGYILTIGFWDVIDILIVAYLIYRVLVFARKTSSGGLLKGIVLLIAVLWISTILHLNVISYLLGNTMELGIIAVIILFQPELRKFLEQVGRSSFFGFFGRKGQEQALETAISQTILACKDLSLTKTGALVVFEKNNRLDDYLITGTSIDAELTADLLRNIFYPKTPLHDGAVIVRYGRIASAGCMLPLSNNINLSRDLGMRHKAGIGISERSDAVVVIVSEETGYISVAVDGMIKRNLTLMTLEKLLTNELLLDSDTKGRRAKIKNIFKVKNESKRDN
jgi:diadenylate cyclase